MSESATDGKLSTHIIKARNDKKKEEDIFITKTDHNEHEHDRQHRHDVPGEKNHKTKHTEGLDHSMGLPKAKKDHHHHHGGSDHQRAELDENHPGNWHARFEHPLHASRKWSTEVSMEVGHKHKTHGESPHRPQLQRQRSMSLEGGGFAAAAGGKQFAKYSNAAVKLGLGAKAKHESSGHDEDDAHDGSNMRLHRKRSFADPKEKKETIDQIRHILENHKEGNTDKMHPHRPRRMGSTHEAPPPLVKRMSSAEWSERLGGNSALSAKLDFLRDKPKEQAARRMAEKEVLKKADAKLPDKYSSRGGQTDFRLREEREAFWARTASHD